MRMYDIIVKKRNGLTLDDGEIRFALRGYMEGTIPDYQMSALLMAIYFQGMTDGELGLFTMAMAESGTMVNLSAIPGVKVDKHSTGGVGDKTTLILAPLVAACGGKVAKMSGRGLGHTGGTIDKMESIPGLRVTLSDQEFVNQVNRIGVSVIGQSDDLAPADKQLYALRDVTGTVESIPLIASSIMSKKLAAGSDAILLDVKVGSGAFMKTVEDATKLAEIMVAIGKHNNRRTMAILTDMDRPLGTAIGNALEIREVIRTLVGEGPDDLVQECLTMGAYMLVLSNRGSFDECYHMVQNALVSGKGLEKLGDMIVAQGGNGDVIHNADLLAIAPFEHVVLASSDGYIHHMNTEQCGRAAVALGAGRVVKEDAIDYGAGIIMHKKTGAFVTKGKPIATLYASNKDLFPSASKLYEGAITITEVAPLPQKSILDIVE